MNEFINELHLLYKVLVHADATDDLAEVIRVERLASSPEGYIAMDGRVLRRAEGGKVNCGEMVWMSRVRFDHINVA